MQWLAPLAVVGGIALMAGAGIVYKEDIKALLHAFIRVVDRCDPLTHEASWRRLSRAVCLSCWVRQFRQVHTTRKMGGTGLVEPMDAVTHV